MTRFGSFVKILKWVFLFFFLLLGIFLLWNYRLVGYGIAQAKGQLRIIREARPIAEVLADTSFPDSLKVNLQLAGDIRQFAFEELGIEPSENYTTVFDQKGKELMFVVSACEPYELKAKEWKFPLIGSFSYKGFFDESKAIDEEKSLKIQGLDTNIRTAGGWSTLGWFNDPILSNMLAVSEADFAETLIHELTHGTVFVKDSLRFNENLATFFGMKGAEQYLTEKYGDSSTLVTDYKKRWANRRLITNHILRGAKYLERLYEAFPDTLNTIEKKLYKDMTISRIIQDIDTLPLYNADKVMEFYLSLNPNNTFFMSFLRYRGDFDLLDQELETHFDGNLKDMLAYYKKNYPSL